MLGLPVRGVGALEFEPANHPNTKEASSLLEIGELVKLAKMVLEQRKGVKTNLRKNKSDAKQLFTRMAFNVLARNQDDHTKNISFLMDQTGTWRLSPAYDITNANDPASKWMNRHQMSINGKREKFTKLDLEVVAKEMNIKKPAEILDQVASGVADWFKYAKEAGISKPHIVAIGKGNLRLQ